MLYLIEGHKTRIIEQQVEHKNASNIFVRQETLLAQIWSFTRVISHNHPSFTHLQEGKEKEFGWLWQLGGRGTQQNTSSRHKAQNFVPLKTSSDIQYHMSTSRPINNQKGYACNNHIRAGETQKN